MRRPPLHERPSGSLEVLTEESFRSQLLWYRSRTRLTQREFAASVGVHPRSVQCWEIGSKHPTTERLQALVAALLKAGGFSQGRELEEAQNLWTAVRHESARMHEQFDCDWFEALLRPPATPPGLRGSNVPSAAASMPTERREDWGEAPDTLGLVDRVDELSVLRRWVVEESCRLIALLGMGGIGKSSLAAKLAQDVAPAFERVYWRGLRDAPPPGEWLSGAIGFLSGHQQVAPASESERIAALLQLLREQRCLLVLDNSEALFEPGEQQGHYREGMEGYGRLLQAVGGTAHRSCVVMASREAPRELAMLMNDVVRLFEVDGLGVAAAQVLLAPKQLAGSSSQWHELNERFGGNGLALKVVGATIRELFDGDIGSFLNEAAGAGSAFGGIRRLLAEHVERSSALERRVLRVLAVEREPLTMADLLGLAALGPAVGRTALLEAVEGLRRRSLVERIERPGAAGLTLQAVVLDYVTGLLVADVAAEIVNGEPELLLQQPLIKALAKDHVRQAQERLIGGPILQRVQIRYGKRGTAERLLELLDTWRDRPAADQGYGPGNVVNLLRLLRSDLLGLDLSRLTIRQAYLADVEARDASLVDSQLAETVLADAFDLPSWVALNGDGSLLAAATAIGEVWLWRVADRAPLLAAHCHTGGVWGVALSADGQLLVTGGGDGTVRLWETSTHAEAAQAGRQRAALSGHAGVVWAVALSDDGQLVASGGGDGTVRIWDTITGRSRAVLQGHTGTVWDVALTPDGRLLASGGGDGRLRLWDVSGARPLATLEGHIGRVWKISLTSDGRLVASGGEDGTVRLWETATGRLLSVLEGHLGGVSGVALSADGRLLASGSTDGTVRLWETDTGLPLATLQGHSGPVFGVALSPDGHLLASNGPDGTVRLWETASARPLSTLQGHTGTVWDVALSPDGRLVASGGGDGKLRVWDVDSGQPVASLQAQAGAVFGVALSSGGQLLASSSAEGTVRLWDHGAPRPRTLQGHKGTVWSVALSADGQLLASGGADGTVRLWGPTADEPVAIMRGHTGGVRSVALSADGDLVASGSEDLTVRLWKPGSTRPLAILRGHTGLVWGVALSADGHVVASGGADEMVRLWDGETGRALLAFQANVGGVWSVALSADGRLVASGGGDGTVRLWNSSTGRPLVVLTGHTSTVWGVALRPDGKLLASGSFDGTVKLWDTETGACLRTLRPERCYERLDITGLMGITAAQRASLLALGAIEHDSPAVRAW